jgi:hypothetical protein
MANPKNYFQGWKSLHVSRFQRTHNVMAIRLTSDAELKAANISSFFCRKVTSATLSWGFEAGGTRSQGLRHQGKITPLSRANKNVKHSESYVNLTLRGRLDPPKRQHKKEKAHETAS